MNSPLLQFVYWLFLFGTAGAFVFSVSYAFFFRWTKTAAGRTLLAFMVSFDLIIVFSLVDRIFGADYWGREVILLAVVGLFALTGWSLVFVLWRRYRKGDSDITVESRHTGSTPEV